MEKKCGLQMKIWFKSYFYLLLSNLVIRNIIVIAAFSVKSKFI